VAEPISKKGASAPFFMQKRIILGTNNRAGQFY
jgi:hypothetical protein